MSQYGTQVGNRIVWNTGALPGGASISNFASGSANPDASNPLITRLIGDVPEQAGRKVVIQGGPTGIVFTWTREYRTRERDWMRNWKEWPGWKSLTGSVTLQAGESKTFEVKPRLFTGPDVFMQPHNPLAWVAMAAGDDKWFAERYTFELTDILGATAPGGGGAIPGVTPSDVIKTRGPGGVPAWVFIVAGLGAAGVAAYFLLRKKSSADEEEEDEDEGEYEEE